MVASVFGVGLFPAAPGTFASIVAVFAGAALMHLHPLALPAAAIVACVAGFAAIPRAVQDKEADPGWVVIDETAGQWLAMTTLGAVTLPGLVLSFCLFRLLDITKPGPIGWADRQHGPFGIMVDDLIAGGLVAIIMYALRLTWPELLAYGVYE